MDEKEKEFVKLARELLGGLIDTDVEDKTGSYFEEANAVELVKGRLEQLGWIKPCPAH